MEENDRLSAKGARARAAVVLNIVYISVLAYSEETPGPHPFSREFIALRASTTCHISVVCESHGCAQPVICPGRSKLRSQEEQVVIKKTLSDAADSLGPQAAGRRVPVR